jgi:hypothetical protein
MNKLLWRINPGGISGERRSARKQRLREVGGVSRLPSHKLKSRFPVLLLNERLDSRTNRTTTNNLAKGAKRIEILGGVPVGSTEVLNLANPGNFQMVVKNFGRKEVNFTCEQHAHHQGIHPT